MSPAIIGILALSGSVAGFMHVASGPDHLAAVAPYAVHAKGRAWRAGVSWGVGHSSGVLGLAVLAFLLRDALNVEAVSAWSERLVGVILVCIGAVGLRSALGAGDQDRMPNQSHPAHAREHATFAVGTVHGLAGGSHLFGIVPALALPTDFAAALYLLAFGLGSIAAMGMFSSAVGWAAGQPRLSSVKVQRMLLGVSSLLAVAIGGVWLISSI